MNRTTFDPRQPGGVRWIHLHVVAILVVLLASSWAAAGGYLVAKHQQESGGYKPSPLNAPTIRLGGTNLPAYWSLEKYSVRIHQQGNSNSCVGQTISTISEILSKERGITQADAGGYIWDELNGGIDQPISYSSAFPTWIASGQAPLQAYGYDGTSPGPYPWASAQRAAYPYRGASWGLVSPWDRVTIEAELHDGLPLAVALPVYSSFYNAQGVSYVASQSGSFLFDHSVTAVGYTPEGIILQNSWGDGWGIHGRVVMAWQALGAYAFAVVAITPVSSWPAYHPKPKPKPKPVFPVARWNATVASYNAHHPKHKHPAASPYYRKALSRIAADWWHSGLSKKFAGPGAVAHWDARNRVMVEAFPGRVIVYEWSRVRGAPLKWTRAGKTIRVNR